MTRRCPGGELAPASRPHGVVRVVVTHTSGPFEIRTPYKTFLLPVPVGTILLICSGTCIEKPFHFCFLLSPTPFFCYRDRTNAPVLTHFPHSHPPGLHKPYNHVAPTSVQSHQPYPTSAPTEGVATNDPQTN